MTRYLRLLALLSLVALLACSKHYFHADAVRAQGVLVQPTQVWTSGAKLWVRTMVYNESPTPITVNRDAIVARLPDGRVVPRAMGTTTVHNTYYVPAGDAHAVYVEFEQPGVNWDVVPTVTIDFSMGLRRDETPITLQMPVQP